MIFSKSITEGYPLIAQEAWPCLADYSMPPALAGVYVEFTAALDDVPRYHPADFTPRQIALAVKASKDSPISWATRLTPTEAELAAMNQRQRAAQEKIGAFTVPQLLYVCMDSRVISYEPGSSSRKSVGSAELSPTSGLVLMGFCLGYTITTLSAKLGLSKPALGNRIRFLKDQIGGEYHHGVVAQGYRLGFLACRRAQPDNNPDCEVSRK